MTLESISKNKPLAIFIFLTTSLFLSSTIGLTIGVIGSFIYLIVVVPVVIGIGLGSIINRNAQDLKINNLYLLITSVFLCAILYYGFYHLGKYETLPFIASIDLFGDISDKNLSNAETIIQKMLEKETGYSGFIGYMFFTAQEGISISKGISVSKISLSGWLAWLYWTLEFAIVTYFSITTVRDGTGQSKFNNDKSSSP